MAKRIKRSAVTRKQRGKQVKPKGVGGRKPTPIKTTKRELQKLLKENNGSVNALARHYDVSWARMKKELEERGVI